MGDALIAPLEELLDLRFALLLGLFFVLIIFTLHSCCLFGPLCDDPGGPIVRAAVALLLLGALHGSGLQKPGAWLGAALLSSIVLSALAENGTDLGTETLSFAAAWVLATHAIDGASLKSWRAHRHSEDVVVAAADATIAISAVMALVALLPAWRGRITVTAAAAVGFCLVFLLLAN